VGLYCLSRERTYVFWRSVIMGSKIVARCESQLGISHCRKWNHEIQDLSRRGSKIDRRTKYDSNPDRRHVHSVVFPSTDPVCLSALHRAVWFSAANDRKWMQNHILSFYQHLISSRRRCN
jgi:hypothetical protein